ncbi:sporulation protein YqfC [Chengkuizengella axinellae]|uniref:Sporulation protein YqfC n=1 Tax=Chengkuizengella axinellae TaxID=3064388 RepID=A0ABT9IUT4_9BACL|nr:sporulation protein YqfC [Chengkuizengella sp. 2205SS18-9]MDP5273093.1 sporulation protein YqfC [Chengkuizengella sp. 2205SS18-9]
MSRIKKKLRKFTANVLDLPKDVIFDLPRITMIGNMQLYVENHRGVVQFTTDKLTLKLSVGHLEIIGKDLVIRAILSEEVFIEGVVEDVKYIQKDV